MKKFVLLALMLILNVGVALAQAEIKFDKDTHDFGNFPDTDPVVTTTFTFTNVGNAPLVIHKAIVSCGCTVPEFTEEPVQPGQTGTVKVTYNGTGKYPGHFKKSITLHSNAKNAKSEMTRIYIEGNMVVKKNEEKK